MLKKEITGLRMVEGLLMLINETKMLPKKSLLKDP